jgi:hypothetical protein
MHHLAVFILAAEESEPSKAPFYVAGGVLAAWAVLVSAFGIRQAEFPASTTAMRGVIVVSAVLVATTVAMALVTS